MTVRYTRPGKPGEQDRTGSQLLGTAEVLVFSADG